MNVQVTTQSRQGNIRHHIIRHLPHDPPMKVGSRLWGNKIIDVRPAPQLELPFGMESLKVHCYHCGFTRQSVYDEADWQHVDDPICCEVVL